MKIRIKKNGQVFVGTTLQIVEAMQRFELGETDWSVGKYIDWFVEQTACHSQLLLTVEGDSDEDKAAALIGALLRTGMAEEL